jgi:hypothetical protein
MVKIINGENNEISIKMGWRFLSYIQGNEKIVFNIEPMVKESDILYIPKNQIWRESSPKWASENKDQILESIKAIDWNRNIRFNKCDIKLKCMLIGQDEFEEGTMESTEAAKEFQRLYLFDPDKKVEKEQVHELWCTLEKRFAEGVNGRVTIYSKSIVENSVFNKITMPTLLENEKVTLNIVGI